MSNVSLGAITNAFTQNTPGLNGGLSGGETGSEGLSFGAVLKNAVHSVDNLNDTAAAQVNNLIGTGNGDMNSVMIAVEKADVSFQLMMQVRNKIVSAYQDIEKMQF